MLAMCWTTCLGGALAACLVSAAAGSPAAPLVVAMAPPLCGPEAPFGAALRDDGGDPRGAAAARRQAHPFVEINLFDADGRLRH